MRQRLAIAGVLALLVIVPLALVGAVRQTDQAAPAATAKHFLKVGRTYHFAAKAGQDGDIAGRVLERPSDNWVKIRVREGDRGIMAWINLNNVSLVMIDPKDE